MGYQELRDMPLPELMLIFKEADRISTRRKKGK